MAGGKTYLHRGTVTLVGACSLTLALGVGPALADAKGAHDHLEGVIDDGTSLTPDLIVDYTTERGPLPDLPAAEPSMAALFPVAGPHSYVDTFGAPRSGGRKHKGTDIFAEKGVPVVAMADGVVEWVRRQPDNRCCTIGILHDNGWRTWYLHLNNDTEGTDDGLADGVAPGLEPGTRVLAGQVIGWVGDSGNAETTPPHLHVEVHAPDGTALNPIATLETSRFSGAVAEARATLPETGWDGQTWLVAMVLLLGIGSAALVATRDRILLGSKVVITIERADATATKYVVWDSAVVIAPME